MTLDEAVAYIRSHPGQFGGASEEMILSQTQSSNDPNYYDPTMYIPEQKKTVVKPNTATRGATVSYPGATQRTAAPKPAATPVYQTSATQGMFGKFSTPSLPIMLSVGLLALGAGMAIYRASR